MESKRQSTQRRLRPTRMKKLVSLRGTTLASWSGIKLLTKPPDISWGPDTRPHICPSGWPLSITSGASSSTPDWIWWSPTAQKTGWERKTFQLWGLNLTLLLSCPSAALSNQNYSYLRFSLYYYSGHVQPDKKTETLLTVDTRDSKNNKNSFVNFERDSDDEEDDELEGRQVDYLAVVLSTKYVKSKITDVLECSQSCLDLPAPAPMINMLQ